MLCEFLVGTFKKYEEISFVGVNSKTKIEQSFFKLLVDCESDTQLLFQNPFIHYQLIQHTPKLASHI